jgi:hypothetical protein
VTFLCKRDTEFGREHAGSAKCGITNDSNLHNL